LLSQIRSLLFGHNGRDFVVQPARLPLQYSLMISFIIPAYNEELELSSTIAAIRHAAATGTAQPYEIIVVDDASTDATAQVARLLFKIVLQQLKFPWRKARLLRSIP
jgi:cellulose synthase/poly-beta-1,6-N-acetylglucosamine synthase-like glycosyltransferase